MFHHIAGLGSGLPADDGDASCFFVDVSASDSRAAGAASAIGAGGGTGAVVFSGAGSLAIGLAVAAGALLVVPDFTAAVKVSPMDCSVAIVALCTSSAWIVLRNMFMLSVSHDSTVFRSEICLLISSTDKVGMIMPGMPMPGTFMPPHRFLTKSSVSLIALIPGIPCIDDFDMLVSVTTIVA